MKPRQRTDQSHTRAMHAILGETETPRRLRVAGAHALMPVAAAATVLLLLLARPASSAALTGRGIRCRLCPVRIEGGEDPHVPLASASAAAASHGAEPQLLPWKQRHRCREVHEM